MYLPRFRFCGASNSVRSVYALSFAVFIWSDDAKLLNGQSCRDSAHTHTLTTCDLSHKSQETNITKFWMKILKYLGSLLMGLKKIPTRSLVLFSFSLLNPLSLLSLLNAKRKVSVLLNGFQHRLIQLCAQHVLCVRNIRMFICIPDPRCLTTIYEFNYWAYVLKITTTYVHYI